MDGGRDGMGGIGAVTVPSGDVEIRDGPAVGEDDPLVAPFAPQHLVDQVVAGPARFPAEAVVCDHHFLHAGLRDQVLERRKIRLAEVALGDLRIEAVAVLLRPGMDGEMLGAGVRLEDGRVQVALQSADNRHAQLTGQVRIFSVGLHTAAPARVTEDVDVRRPEGQSLVLSGDPGSRQGLPILDPGLVADRRKHLVHKRFIERSRHTDRHREDRRLPVARHAVQRLVPPVVGGDAQRFHGRGVMHHQVRFLLQRQGGDKGFRPSLRTRAAAREHQQHGPYPSCPFHNLPN